LTLESVTGPKAAVKFAEVGHSEPVDNVNFCFENVILLPAFEA
jgi:hypothetical protein